MGSRQSWSELRAKRLAGPAAKAGYERARLAFGLAEQVRAFRLDKGLSQEELAQRIGSTQPAIARLEAGGLSPTLGTLERIAEALDLRLDIRFARTSSPAKSRRARSRTA
jgi:HTH-type transcriptional regulator/antitoxin HipB